MSGRGWLVALVLLAAGVAGGYAAGQFSDARAQESAGSATPVPASGPSLPVDPPRTLEPDPDFPPLAVGLKTHREPIVEGNPFSFDFPVPNGWVRTQTGPAEAAFRDPGCAKYCFKLRVESVLSSRTSVERIKAQRIADLDAVTDDFELLRETADGLEFSYVEGGYLRLGVLRWLDLGAGIAEAEIAMDGRAVDRSGMISLIEVVAAGTRG